MDLIFFLEWINFWVKLDKNLFFIIYFNLIILLFIKMVDSGLILMDLKSSRGGGRVLPCFIF